MRQPDRVHRHGNGHRENQRVRSLRTAQGLATAISVALVLVSISALLALATPAKALRPSDAAGADGGTAAETLNKAIVDNPGQVDLYLRLADLYMSPGSRDLDAAAVTLKRSIAVDPGSSEAYLRLGTLELMRGHSKAALRVLDQYEQLSNGG